MVAIIDFLVVTFSPKYWMQVNPLWRPWDKELNQLLNAGYRFTGIEQYNANIGGRKVWIANHPYGSFTVGNGSHAVRPKRRTIRKAYRHLMKDYWTTHMQEGL